MKVKELEMKRQEEEEEKLWKELVQMIKADNSAQAGDGGKEIPPECKRLQRPGQTKVLEKL